MADIDSIIAGGARTQADFNAIPGIATSYWQGLDEAAKNRQRNVFKDGFPTNSDGTPDYGSAFKSLAQIGDLSDANQMAALDLARQKLKFGQQSGSQDFPTESQAPARADIPPSPSRTASTPVAPAINQGRPQPQAVSQPSSNVSTGENSIVGIVGKLGIPDELAGPIIGQVSALAKTDPNAPLDPQMAPRVAQIAQAVVQRNQQAQQPAQPQQQQQPQTPAPQGQVSSTQQPISADPTLGGLVPHGRTPQQQINALSQRVASGMLTPEQEKVYSAHISAIQSALQPTGEAKNYNLYATQEKQAGRKPLPFNEYQADIEAKKSTATEQAKSDVKEQTDLISAGRTAQNRLATLNTIANIVNTDKNLTTGFGADTALKVKMALEQMGVPVGDLSGAQSIQKLNAVLASESTKAISPRPAQFEFKTFLSNNPGLNLDKAGNQRVIGIYSQLAKREVDLGRLARQNRDNWDNWDQVVQNYDKQNPMRDPKTGQPITTDTIIAPGKSDDVFSKARAALAQGANKDAVIKRLKEHGHDPAGL